MDMHSIYEEYYNRVLNYASARLPCRMDAEDICEDVFERVLTCLDAFDPDRASMSTWIFVITRNCVIDFYRCQRPTVELTDDLPQEGDVDDALIRAETVDALTAAMDRLPGQLREIVALHYHAGLPLTQISRRLGISYGAVKGRHAKALSLLREFLHSSF